MKQAIYSIAIIAFILLSSCRHPGLTISVHNNSDFDRINDMVELPIETIALNISLKEGQTYNVKDSNGKIIPSQVTYNNLLIFQPNLKAKESRKFKITPSAPQSFEVKSYGNHHPERYGDFAWENDRIGFRFYGEPLTKIQAPTNGLDLWYKRTEKIVLDEWYRKEVAKEASYHVDHGEGCDPYAVGRTLGGGSMSPYIDGVLMQNDNFSTYTLYENGPLRMTVKLVYPSQIINGVSCIDTKTISLDVGSQLTRISQEYISDTQSEPFSVAAGFAKRLSNDSLLYHSKNNYMVYREPRNNKNGQIYLGLIIPEGIEEVEINAYTYTDTKGKSTKLANTLATTKYTPGIPTVYYTGFGWDKFGFDNAEQFEEYVSRFSQSLAEPFIVTY